MLVSWDIFRTEGRAGAAFQSVSDIYIYWIPEVYVWTKCTEESPIDALKRNKQTWNDNIIRDI